MIFLITWNRYWPSKMGMFMPGTKVWKGHCIPHLILAGYTLNKRVESGSIDWRPWTLNTKSVSITHSYCILHITLWPLLRHNPFVMILSADIYTWVELHHRNLNSIVRMIYRDSVPFCLYGTSYFSMLLAWFYTSRIHIWLTIYVTGELNFSG